MIYKTTLDGFENSKSIVCFRNIMSDYKPDKSSRWKEEILRLLLIMVATGGVLAMFIHFPSFPVLVLGILSIAGVAYLSERKGTGYERILMSRKAVVVTGCDTGE